MMVFNTDGPFILLRLSFVLLVSLLAVKRNRSPFWWGIFGLVLPPIALVVIWLSDDLGEEYTTTATDVENNAYETSIAAGNEPSVAVQDARAARERYNALPERQK